MKKHARKLTVLLIVFVFISFLMWISILQVNAEARHNTFADCYWTQAERYRGPANIEELTLKLGSTGILTSADASDFFEYMGGYVTPVCGPISSSYNKLMPVNQSKDNIAIVFRYIYKRKFESEAADYF